MTALPVHPLVLSQIIDDRTFHTVIYDDDLSLVVRTGYLNRVCGFIFFVQGCRVLRPPFQLMEKKN